MRNFLKPDLGKIIGAIILFSFLVIFFLPVEKTCSGSCPPEPYKSSTPIYNFKWIEGFGSPQFEQVTITTKIDYLFVIVELVLAYIFVSFVMSALGKLKKPKT